MPRYLIKMTGPRAASIHRIRKGMTKTQLRKKRTTIFKGYKLITSKTQKKALEKASELKLGRVKKTYTYKKKKRRKK